MKTNRRLFAAALALGALLCVSPAASALEAQPQPEADLSALTTADAPDESAADMPIELPILPEKPPIQISYTTPEEIGFEIEEDEVNEEEPLPAAPEAEAGTDAEAPETTLQPAASAPADTAAPETSPAPSEVPTLPQTGVQSFAALFAAGLALLSCGALLCRSAQHSIR